MDQAKSGPKFKRPQPNQDLPRKQDDCNRPKRNPYCSRCRNHGKSAQVKGHKRHCEYRDCQCEGCKLVECRLIVSAAQIKRRRYQKQDEEFGWQIEISPPVLTREPNNDPATLIAKTLIGSAGAKHVQQQAQLEGARPALGPETVSHQLNSSAAAASNLHGAHHLSQLNQLAMGQHESQQPGGSSAASSALNSALHLFRFPNSVLSAMNPQVGGSQQAPSRANQTTSDAAMPSAREQISLVEDIYHAFGPLAIYAWLRSEQFDLQKVRDLIELSRVPFDELSNY